MKLPLPLNDNSTVASIIFSVQDPANPVGHFIASMWTRAAMTPKHFLNGGGSGFWDTSRQLTPRGGGSYLEMTLRIDYDGTDTLRHIQ